MPSCISGQIKCGYTTLENSLSISYKVEHTLVHRPEIPLVYPLRGNRHMSAQRLTHVHSSFIHCAPSQKQLNKPNSRWPANQSGYTYIAEDDLFIKTCIHPKDTMLPEEIRYKLVKIAKKMLLYEVLGQKKWINKAQSRSTFARSLGWRGSLWGDI